jgi:N-acetylmuramoyl-L-alanine amidase
MSANPTAGRHRLVAPRARRLAIGLVPAALALALAAGAVGWGAGPGASGDRSAGVLGSVGASSSAGALGSTDADPSASAKPSPLGSPASPDPASPDPASTPGGAGAAGQNPAAGGEPSRTASDNFASGQASSRPAAPDLPSLDGRVVALDPGHGPAGGSSAQVPNGRGGTKDCQTSGTATDAGYPEHAFNYDVALRVRALLQAQAATVHLTRGDDPSEQVCVDKRGTFAQDTGSELLVSIHGDGNADRTVKGFFAIVSDPPLNQAQGQPSLALAEALLGRLRAAGFTQNSAYPGGLSKRSDIAGVSLSTKPVVMLELGEMRNPDEAAQMSSPEGRQRYAEAVAAGIADWLVS